ncbi:hypothetical protein GQ44DRAFT_700975 [Phaeosphaeriaceae sp. PMI808]|nr:hypothetical protein GQ44DRAFT_700975 [Phaeosphaeriaceae sp. PMI808]
MHPLAIAFKDTSDDYRRHLYESATVKINSTLKILLNKLYEGTLQPIDSTPNDNQTSPIRLTVPAKFEREALKLYQPISAYQVRLTRTNSDGERVPFMSTLEKRMFDYEAYVATQKVEIEEIRKNWLIVVGEIWKLGVHCLGESFMESMLFTGKETHQPSSSPEETESAFFVPEQDPSPPPRTRRSNKRVTFEMPETGDELMGGKSKALDFLYQSSRLSHQPLPVMPKQKIAGIEKQVKGLGKKEIEDYQKAEKDYKVYWQLKVAKLKEALEED